MPQKKGTCMKNKSLLLYTLVISTNISGMKRQLANQPVKIQPATTTLIALPEDCWQHIVNPKWNHWQPTPGILRSYNNILKSLRSTANNIDSLRQVSKSFNTFFSLPRIAALLQVDDSNKSLFLLRAAQAGIPCLVQYAITIGADVHYDTINKSQPLMGAVKNKNYVCAELLLNANASTEQSTKHRPVHLQPIQFATEAGDLRMVTLLLKFDADPNTTTPLYSDPTVSQSALDIALNKRHPSIAELLIEKGAVAKKRDLLKLQDLQETVAPFIKRTRNKTLTSKKF
jgi:ankyrin repeat protein